MLYRTSSDPDEVNNLAFDETYQQTAIMMKNKLLSIVLADDRVEVDWGKRGEGTEVFRSTVSPKADDNTLNLGD